MCLNNGIRLIVEQPRGPQCGVKIVTLGFELGRQAAVEYHKTDVDSVSEGGAHPNLSVEIAYRPPARPGAVDPRWSEAPFEIAYRQSSTSVGDTNRASSAHLGALCTLQTVQTASNLR